MARGYDEPFTLYGLLADASRPMLRASYVTFTLDPAARFSDGKPVTPRTSSFPGSCCAITAVPIIRTYYAKVAKAEALDARTRAFRSRRRRRPRTAADPRPDAGAGQARGRSRDVRGDDLRRRRSAAGLTRSARSTPGRERHVHARSELLGPRSADQSRPVEFRQHPLRLLSRRQHAFRGVQERPLRRARRDRSRPLADGLRLSRGARRPRRQGGIPQRPAEGHGRTRLQHAPADVRRHPRARGDRCICSISNGSTTTISSISTGARASYFDGSESVRARRPADARERALLAPFPGAVRPDILDGTWSPPKTDGSGRDRARPAARPRAARPPPATSSTAPRCTHRGSGRPLRLRDPRHHPRPGTARARLRPQPRSAPASTPTCASSTPCSTTSAESLSTST